MGMEGVGEEGGVDLFPTPPFPRYRYKWASVQKRHIPNVGLDGCHSYYGT